MAKSQKRVIITGSSGFIGHYIVKELLKNDYDVRAVDYQAPKEKIKGAKYIEGNIFEPKFVEKTLVDCDLLVHLIGQADIGRAEKDPSESFKINLESLQIVLDRCRVAKIPKIIFPSTASVYGKATIESINEQYTPNPCTIYGWHKLLGEQMLEAYHMSYGVKYVILRLFNVYGIGNKGVIPYFLKCARETKKIEGFGGHQLRDFVHVEEVANALYLSTIIDDVENKIINIGTGLGIKIADLARMIGEFYPGTEINFKENMNYMPYHAVADPTLAKKLLGFKPHDTLDYLKKRIKEMDDNERK